MFTIKPYTQSKNINDQFVDSSNINSFLMMRDYMDYHSDRFQIIHFSYKKDKLALLPATLHKEANEIISHGDLTYILISTQNTAQIDVMECFQAILEYFRNQTGAITGYINRLHYIYGNRESVIYMQLILLGAHYGKILARLLILLIHKYSTQNKAYKES